MNLRRCLVLLACLAGALPSAASAQLVPGIKRTPLQNFEVPGTVYQTVMGTAEIGPGLSIGKHSHFGIEAGYVLEGDFIMLVEGEAPKTYKAGDSYVIPVGKAHDARAGDKGAKVLATYVVEKGKPLATPLP